MDVVVQDLVVPTLLDADAISVSDKLPAVVDVVVLDDVVMVQVGLAGVKTL